MRAILTRYWIVALGFLALLSCVIINQSLRNTLNRQRALRHTEDEITQTSAEITHVRSKIKKLENNPVAYEELVRSELGYLRPGEKEVRVNHQK